MFALLTHRNASLNLNHIEKKECTFQIGIVANQVRHSPTTTYHPANEKSRLDQQIRYFREALPEIPE